MLREIIDLRKQSALMKAVQASSSVPLTMSSDVRASDASTPAPAPSQVANSGQPSDEYMVAYPHIDRDMTTQADHRFDLEWSSYEHEYRIRGPYWFVYPLTAATAGIVFGIAAHSYLFVSFVAIAFLMLTYYAKQPPRMLHFAIEKRGVWMGDKLLDYSKVKSFWIFTHALMAPELLLETASPINPLVHIRLEGVDADGVKRAISRYLPEKEQKDRASHQITRIIGF